MPDCWPGTGDWVDQFVMADTFKEFQMDRLPGFACEVCVASGEFHGDVLIRGSVDNPLGC